ncbi:hypothetical protein vseg_008771 [Gypsophila vaccaria]
MDIESQIKHATASHLLTTLSTTTTTTAAMATATAALCELRLLTKSDPTIRPIILSHDGGTALTHLSSHLLLPTTSTVSQDAAAATLLNLSLSLKLPLAASPAVISALSHSLASHRNPDYSPSAVQSSAATVFSLSLLPSLRSTLGSNHRIVSPLIDIVRTYDSALQTVRDAVKALFGLALYPPNRGIILELGGGAALFDRVVFDNRNDRIGVVEDVTAVIAQVAGFEGSPGIFKSVGGIRVLVGLVDQKAGGVRRVRENAVSALLKLVEFGGEAVVEEIREVGLGFVFEGLREVARCGNDKGKFRAQSLMNVLESGINSTTANVVSSEIGSVFGSSPLLNSCSS